MRDKNLGKDGITEKYNFRCDTIKCIRNIGAIGGGIYSIWGIGHQNLGEIFFGVGLGASSYLIGNYFYIRDKIRKEKALKNLEGTLEGDRK